MYTLVIGRAYPSKDTGMMGIFEFEQAKALNKYGMKTIYAFCDTRSIKSLRRLNYTNFKNTGVPVYGYHFPIGGIPQGIFDKLKTKKYKRLLKKIIQKHGKPTYIHIHFPLLSINLDIWEMLKQLNIPIIVTEHWSKVQTKKIEKFRVELLKKIVEESSEFICVGEPLKRSVIELSGTNKDIKVIPNMLNEHFYYKPKPKTSQFRFISVGRLVDVKRFELTVEAFAKAFPTDSNVVLDIVGSGPNYAAINEVIKKFNIKDRVIMHGFQPREKTADLIRASDAYVSASVLETFGVPFIEAMACGKPVIGAKNGPLDYHISKNQGVLFEPDDINDLINSFKLALKNSINIEEKYISIYAQEHFSEESICNQLKILYTELNKEKLDSIL